VSNYIPTEEFLKECGFEPYNLTCLVVIDTLLENYLYYDIRHNEFSIASSDKALNIQSDSDLTTFLKIINQNKV